MTEISTLSTAIQGGLKEIIKLNSIIITLRNTNNRLESQLRSIDTSLNDITRNLSNSDASLNTFEDKFIALCDLLSNADISGVNNTSFNYDNL